MKKQKLVFGTGINDADYPVTQYEKINGKRVRVWVCPFYDIWCSMLRRCYSANSLVKYSSYKDCQVCTEWLTFSNFKKWMEQQEWEGRQIDKDLLKEGNKLYCPEHCIFVDRKINSFVTDSKATRGEYMLGVYWHKPRNKFLSKCSNPFTGEQEHLGYFTSELEAHLTWKRKKHEHAYALADSEYCNDPRLSKSLKSRYL